MKDKFRADLKHEKPKDKQNIFVIGASGAGKSHIVKTMHKKYPNIYDADLIKNLGDWFKGSKQVEFPRDADERWLSEHQYVWREDILKRFIEKHAPLVLFGMSGNCFSFLDLFDTVFFLDVPEEIVLKRLAHESRENPMGKTEDQKKAVAAHQKHLIKEAKRSKLVFIDGKQKPEFIMKRIML